jgi:hypothetical protein
MRLTSIFTAICKLGIFSTLAVTSCSEPLPSPSLVVGLRILALRATPSVTHATRIEAIVAQGGGWLAHANDAGLLPRVDWFLCATTVGTDPAACVQSPANLQWVGTGSGIDVAPQWLAASSPRLLFATYCFGQQAQWLPQRGALGCPDESTLPYAQTDGVVAFRTLQAPVEGAADNHNPSIRDLLVNGQSTDNHRWIVARCTSADRSLCPSISIVALPTNDAAEPDATGQLEQLLVSFYALSGSFDRPRATASSTAPNGEDRALSARWYAPANAETTGFAVVLRDNRGGVSVEFGELIVQ